MSAMSWIFCWMYVVYCGQISLDAFDTFKTFLRRIFTEFESKVNVQNHKFGWVHFQNRFF